MSLEGCAASLCLAVVNVMPIQPAQPSTLSLESTMTDNARLVEFLRLHQQMSLQAEILRRRINDKYGVRPDAVEQWQVRTLSDALDALRVINQDLTMMGDDLADAQ